MDIDTKVEAARFSGAAAGLSIWGATLNEWVAIATIIYLGLQVFILIPKAVNIVSTWIEHVTRKR
jgi:hypothetical protein